MSRVSSKPPPGGGPSAPEAPAEARSLPWWKLVLLYPTLAVSIVSAIPTYLELMNSMRLGVPYGQSDQALRENRLWQDNIDCAAAPFDGLANKQNVQVDAVVCRSGNVLVRVKPPEASTAYKWVPLDSVVRMAGGFSLIGSAHAQTAAPASPAAGANFEVKCQEWVGNGLIRRRILDRASGRCFDEVVNTFTGKVVSSSPATQCHC